MATQPFDPSADPVVNQTAQISNANNLKSFHHFWDAVAQQAASDLLEEGRASRNLSRQSSHALGARIVESILGRQVEDAETDSLASTSALAAGQQDAKIAQSTPPETGITTMLAQINAQIANMGQQNQAFLLQLMALLGQNPVGK